LEDLLWQDFQKQKTGFSTSKFAENARQETHGWPISAESAVPSHSGQRRKKSDEE